MRVLSTILRWVALCGFGAGLAGCPFEQIEFDPYSRPFVCETDADCLTDQFCHSEPMKDESGQPALDGNGEQLIRRTCKAKPTTPLLDAGLDDGGPGDNPGASGTNTEVECNPPHGEQAELCDGIDNDCDGSIDERSDAEATEICDAIDNDCDGSIDESADADRDGVQDICDNCPDTPNPDQTDLDFNGIGDDCERPAGVGNQYYALGECIEDVAGSALPVDGAYRNPPDTECASWEEALTDFSSSECLPAASCAEAQYLLEADSTMPSSLGDDPQVYRLKTGTPGEERERRGRCLATESPYIGQENAVLPERLGWEMINSRLRRQLCDTDEDCGQGRSFTRCVQDDAGERRCEESFPSDHCPDARERVLNEYLARSDLDTRFERCQMASDLTDEHHIERFVGIDTQTISPFSMLWLRNSADLPEGAESPQSFARCVLTWKERPSRLQSQTDMLRMMNQLIETGVIPLPYVSIKGKVYRDYHLARGADGISFSRPEPHPDFPMEFEINEASMPAERTTANARLSENDPTAVNVFPAVDFTLTQPAELACIIREARAVSLNVQFNNVELPGGCESSGLPDRVDPDAPLRICNPEEPGDACAVEGGDCSRAALNLRWICALNTDTRVLVRPLCIDEALP